MTQLSAPARRVFDDEVVTRADLASRQAIDDLLSGGQLPRAVVISAPAGGGKSFQISKAVCRVRKQGLRVAVAAPTNEQAFGLVRTISALYRSGSGGRTVTFVPASNRNLPDSIAQLPGVQQMKADQVAGEGVIVGTLDKFGNAFARGDLEPVDALLIDESFQADSAKYFAVAGLAPLHLLVGDGGQISPFSTIDDPGRWRGLPEDPLQTAVGVLLRNHPTTPVHGLPITRRLDERAVRVARLFYPNLHFDPVVLPGVRELRIRTVTNANSSQRKFDRALDLSAQNGWAHVELPQAPVLQVDPEAIHLIAKLVRRLFDRAPKVRCEREPRLVALQPEQVAVGVSHNDQKELLHVALQGQGLGDVVVETANKLQGLEFEVVFAWHPLAGLPEADSFHLDPGRMCVLLTRHRQACVVIGRVGDRDLVQDRLPPPTSAYLGWDPDPVLDGWEVHRDVFAALEQFRCDV